MKYFWREPCSLVVLAILSWSPAVRAQAPVSAVQQRAAARSFLQDRGPAHAHKVASARRAQTQAQAQAMSSLATWSPAGPMQTQTAAFGAITGRITSLAVDPADTTGNTIYAGTTGGGVWKSTNAAGPAAAVQFVPITDDAPASDAGIGSLSIGAVSVQPGGNGVVLAGTGDPNDALDSYFGSGILRSTDNGATWTNINEANIRDYTGLGPYSFYGEGFSGFAWGPASSGLVVAAVTQAYDGTALNAPQSDSVEGLYYSLDAGATWNLSTLQDAGQIFQSPLVTNGPPGNAVTSVVWNPMRQSFYAAIRYHGYYSSPDGVTWTRLLHQPGLNLSTAFCPNYGYSPGSISCPIFRGALAVQPVTGDMFAFTVDANLADQGIWRDVCAAANGTCSTGTTVLFSTQVSDTALQDGNGHITQGDYSLWLAAIPANADTLLYAGTVDIFKRSLAASNVPWRNATNTGTCAAARVASAQHAMAAGTGSLLYFGNDGGLWRTTDGINQQSSACSADDATHFDNLNGGIGSLADVTSVAQAASSASTLLVGLGVNGTAGTATQQALWPQVLDGVGAYTAIDPNNPQNWYATSGPGVSISLCSAGSQCVPALFPYPPTVGDQQTGSDGQFMESPVLWMLDPQDSATMLVGTCRVWRGGSNGIGWTAISPVLGDAVEPDCSGEGQIQAFAVSGTVPGTTNEVLYAGMEGTPRGGGTLPYGGLVAGHVFTATVAVAQSGVAAWADLFAAPVVNDEANRGQFNPGGFGVSSLVIDPHDLSGQTVYATIQGFSGDGISEPIVYRSTSQGQSWTNITANLPITPVNALVVDPGDANTVYLGTDAGVYMTSAVLTCSTGAEQCWTPYGTGLPDAPVTTLSTNGVANSFLLMAGTYGRGVYQTLLASACDVDNGVTSIAFNPGALVFGNQPIGSSGTLPIVVTNNGSTPLCVTGVGATGGFMEQDNCMGAALLPAATCTVSVTFTPSAQLAYNSLLTVSGNVPGGVNTALLSGKGIAAQIQLSPAQLNFGPVAIGVTSAMQSLVIANVAAIGGVTVTLQAPAVAGDFQIQATSCAASVAPQTSCTIGIVFTPSRSGVESGVFSIATSAGTFTAPLSGSGLAPATDTLSPMTLSFGQQTIGTASTAQTVTLTNSGDQPLTSITASSSSNEFIANFSGCATNLPGHASCAVTVYFAPQTPGARSGTLTISDSLHAGASALSVALAGAGTAPLGAASMAPASLDFGAEGLPLTPPLVAAQQVTITNNGSAAITGLSLLTTGDFAVASGTCTSSLAVHATCTASVTFTPTATGPRSGSLTATGSNLGHSLTTALTGIGLNFTLSVNSASTVTVVTGTAANYQFGLTPLGASSGAVTLSCTGAPAGSTCTVNPANVQLTSGVTASIGIAVATPALPVTSLLYTLGQRCWLLACVLPVCPGARRRRCLTLVTLLCLGGIGGLAGCGAHASGGGAGGGGTGPVNPISSTYTLTITAAAPGIQQTATVTLVLEQ